MLLSYFLATRVNSYLYCDLLENEEEATGATGGCSTEHQTCSVFRHPAIKVIFSISPDQLLLAGH